MYITSKDIFFIYINLETPKSVIAASDQGLYSTTCKYFSHIFFRNILITQPDIPKLEIRPFQYIVLGVYSV